ncbi:hypothetical protein BEL04_01875 [Mucilaginibacter sp. PPCGB 2223]|uniref:YciI family protein n=1 Tax=Mucilaginibacter sp. PPCGB 2223 TaxID=1886027 RepID=UPI0008254DD7|nr:YciI family protein [Mucilaginibacter sp. PPCGB 2223]OCX53089.1 hypothetical protein BEL04_01875 [Mucilaginibacter sp. PPCGB 2223]
MPHYMLKLVPCRPSFAQDMTDAERAVMMEHIAYWKPYLEDGTMIVFGPVADPAGAYGLGIVAVDSEEQAKQLMADDPASKINTYEYYPMRAVTKG